MPIVARQPGPGAVIGLSGPPPDLLPSGGAPASAPALAPHRALALDAFHLLRTRHDRPRDADPWGEPAFVLEVELVRGQLAPIRSRRGLASSFRREAALQPGMGRAHDPAALRALRVAYAVRWLELGDGVARAGWIELATDPG